MVALVPLSIYPCSLALCYLSIIDLTLQAMVLILDGNSEHVAHAWRKIGFL